MCEKCFVQTKNCFNRIYLPVMENDFSYNQASLKQFLKILMVGGATEKSHEMTS